MTDIADIKYSSKRTPYELRVDALEFAIKALKASNVPAWDTDDVIKVSSSLESYLNEANEREE